MTSPPLIVLPFSTDSLHDSQVWIDFILHGEPVKEIGILHVDSFESGEALRVTWSDSKGETKLQHQHYLTQHECRFLAKHTKVNLHFSLNKSNYKK